MAAPKRPPVSGPIDPRGPRFGAAITTVLLALIIVLGPGSQIAGVLLAIQTVMFAFGAVIGVRQHPYGWLFRRFVRPRLGEPKEMEAPEPPQFAQAVGLVFALLGAIGWLVPAPLLFYVAIGCALAAAFLNAVFGVCIGCELYLIIARNRKGTRLTQITPQETQPQTEPQVDVATDEKTGKKELL